MVVALLAAACGSGPNDHEDQTGQEPVDAGVADSLTAEASDALGQAGAGGASGAGGQAGQCVPDCAQARCGDPNGCGGTCKGACPDNEWCDKDHVCQCGAAPHYVLVDGGCLPSCGALLLRMGLPDFGMGCCGPTGCKEGTVVGTPGETNDCVFCCTGSTPETVCLD